MERMIIEFAKQSDLFIIGGNTEMGEETENNFFVQAFDSHS